MGHVNCKTAKDYAISAENLVELSFLLMIMGFERKSCSSMNKLSFSGEKVETNFLLTCNSAFYLCF